MPSKPTVGFIGARNYASRVLIPTFKAGRRATENHRQRKWYQRRDPWREGGIWHGVDLPRHADLVVLALNTCKHIFVEKPLVLALSQVDDVMAAYRSVPTAQHLIVGFNRRFAPQIRKMKSLLAAVHEPKVFTMMVNAGTIPSDHWTSRLIQAAAESSMMRATSST